MRLPLLSAVLLLNVVGCALDEPDLTESESAVSSSNKLSANKLSANKLSANKLSANKLSANSLQVQGMMNTADGRDVLSYVVSCALPAGSSLVASDSTGVQYTFPGSLGLAPEWATGVPTASNRRWVSACLLARTNYFGVAVPISMRSDTNVKLAASATEISTYNSVEGAFWGDLFGTTQYEYACAAGPFTATTDQGIEGERDCTRTTDGTNTMCGFTFTGYCGTTYPGKTIPCTDKTAPFGSCKGGATSYAEVITIYIQH